MDSCFSSSGIVIILRSALQIDMIDYLNKNADNKALKFKEPFSMRRIFTSDKADELIIVTNNNNRISKLNLTSRKFVAFLDL